MDIFSTREIAVMIWSSVFLFFILKYKNTRESIANIIEILFSKVIIIPFILIMSYSVFLLFGFTRFKIKEYIEFKEVIMWLLFSGVPLCYSVATKAPDKNHFKEIISKNIKFVILVEFIISTFTFSLIIELLILPMCTLLFMLEAVFSMKKEYRGVNKFISNILAIAGFIILYMSFSLAIKNYKELNSIKSLVSILTPIMLSILYLPIIFLFGIWFNYDNIFFRLKTNFKYNFKVLKNNIKRDKRIKYKYKIVKVDDISTGVAKRKSITIILEEQYGLKDIENICIEQFAKYNYKNDVVWIYVATNKENYIISNWIVQAQWISSKLENKFRPMKIGEMIKDDINFKYNKSYYKQEEYYRRNIFKDDKSLFINNMKLYDKVSSIYNIMSGGFEDREFNGFFNICQQYKDCINNISYKYGDIGISKSIEFEDYLQRFQNYIALIGNIILVTLDESREFKNKKYLIQSNMEELDKVISKIEGERYYWMKKLGITLEEYERAKFKENTVD
ncbi:hypothetical protein HAHI6034_12045 [Hathewaya histolytica]|uniref:Uncharacterized protein n=1 Tax=Hathewaya histolytica TaxID=1498 RepID=A0A4U9RQK7_HATHI|nr:hypothetical protein [Hathewaya histolytica]VTQ93821.1 Uncharacterised protein [Hathewaya histolytica]